MDTLISLLREQNLQQIQIWRKSFRTGVDDQPGRENKLKAVVVALLYTLPALLGGLGMQFQASFYAMIFTGGNRVFFTNFCEAVLFPYFIVFILALGTLVTPNRLPAADANISSLDYNLTRFFSGAGVLIICGFVLGLLDLLRPQVTLPIFCLVLFFYFLHAPRIFSTLFLWTLTLDPSTGQALKNNTMLRFLSLCQRLGIFVGMVLLVLVRGIVPEVVLTPDVMQVYSGYLSEIRLNHSIWLDPSHPVVFDFLVGRGNGVHLFLSSFTSSYVNQLIGCIYFFSFAVITHRIVSLMIPRKHGSIVWRIARCTLPELAMLLVISLGPLSYAQFGKYHLQTGAILLFLTWISLLFLFFNQEQGKWFYIALIPVCIAFPISSPEYEVFIFVVFFLAAVALILVRQNAFFKYFAYLLVLSSVISLSSFLFNQLYAGIPEINPYYVFSALSNPDRLHLWTSPEQIMYVNLSHPSQVQFGLSGLSLESFLRRFSELTTSLSQGILASLIVGPAVLFVWLLFHIRIYYRILKDLVLVPLGLSFIIGSGLLFYWIGEGGLEHLDSRKFNFYLDLFILILWICLSLLLFPLRHLILRLKKPIAALLPYTDSRIYLFGFIFFSYFFGAWILMLIVNHPSLQGEFWYQAIYPIILLFLIIIFFIHLVQQLFSQDRANQFTRLYLRNIFKMVAGNDLVRQLNASALLVIVMVVLLAYVGQEFYSFGDNYPISPPIAVEYFIGHEKLEKTISRFEPIYPWVNFQRCLDIGLAVPGNSIVLPLNALASMPACNFTPLLPRNKVIQNFQSILAPYYKTLLYGQPDEADPIYKQQGVNYFYVRKNDSQFWGPGFAHSFDRVNLTNNFDIFWESDDAYILTWRGQGIRSVSEDEASYIEALRAKSTTSTTEFESSGWYGFTRLRDALKISWQQ